MTFPREYPLGVPSLQVISSQNFENWDVRISKAINGVDGDTIAGAVEFESALLTTNSAINTDGYIVTTGDVTAANVIGTQSVTSDSVVAESALATESKAYRTVPRGIGAQTIDTSTGAVLALNFTTRDHWLITLENGADPAVPAVLATVATLIDTVASPGDPGEVLPMAKISIEFRASSSQTGGIGISSSATVFPASFHGLTKADLVGPRSGANTGLGGENDWIRIELQNIGTAAVPRYACTVSMGAG